MGASLDKLPHVYTEGDTKPSIVGVVSGINITGYTITLRMARNDGTALVKTPLLITDAPQGEFAIIWVSTDLVPGCDQPVDIEIIDTAAEVVTSERFLIDVKEKIQ